VKRGCWSPPRSGQHRSSHEPARRAPVPHHDRCRAATELRVPYAYGHVACAIVSHADTPTPPSNSPTAIQGVPPIRRVACSVTNLSLYGHGYGGAASGEEGSRDIK
jgi:hypothetical protein